MTTRCDAGAPRVFILRESKCIGKMLPRAERYLFYGPSGLSLIYLWAVRADSLEDSARALAGYRLYIHKFTVASHLSVARLEGICCNRPGGVRVGWPSCGCVNVFVHVFACACACICA